MTTRLGHRKNKCLNECGLTTVETSSSEVFLLYDYADNDCDTLVKFKGGRTPSVFFLQRAILLCTKQGKNHNVHRWRTLIW